MSSQLHKFLIILESPSLLYFPGQYLTGKVLVELASDTSFVGLYLHVLGEGCIQVTNRGQQVYDKENYIDFRLRLLGETELPPVLLSSGVHSFPFKLGLPVGLPSTFLGKFGFIQFFCKAVLREPNGIIHKNKQVFIIINPIDLSIDDGRPSSAALTLTEPVQGSLEENIGRISCLKSGIIICKVRLDKGGYVPGENIHIRASIENQSNVTIAKTEAILTESIKYLSRGKVILLEKRRLSATARSKIKAGEIDNWMNERLIVPPVPPSNLTGCHLIKIQHHVLFIIQLGGFNKKIKLELPIVIGTFPTDNAIMANLQGSTNFPSILPVYRELKKVHVSS